MQGPCKGAELVKSVQDRTNMQGAALSGFDPSTRAALLAHAAAVTLPAGSVLFRPGDLCTQFPILLSGCLRVYRIARSGREMLLYRVAGGET